MAEGIDPVSLEEQRKQAVDRLFTEEAADEDQRKAFRQQSWDMTQPPPDQAGEALQLGNRFGVPRKAVEADPEYWKRRDQEARRKLLMEASPRTMAWLDDEDNYAVAKDDVDILSQIESTFSKIGYAAKGGFQRFMASGDAVERQAMGETMEFYRRRDEWEAREERRKKLGQDAPRGWRTIKLPQVGSIGAGEIPYWYGNLDAAPAASGIVREEVRKALPESMRPMFASQVGIDDAKAVRGVLERRMEMVDARARAKVEEFTETLEKAQTGNYVADGLLSGVTSLTEMAPSMAVFFALRGRGGATVASGAMGVQVAGAEYLEGIYNLNLSERDASDRALLQAGVEIVTERISLGYLDELLKSDRGFVSKLALSMGQEQIQEQAATLGNRLVDIPYVDQDMTIGRFVEETPYYAGQTALATLVASGITNTTLIGLDTAVRDMVERSLLSQPSAGDAAIDAVLKKAKESRLGKRSPEKLKDVLDRQAAGTGVETVTVDLDELAQALKEKGVELSDALDGLGVPRDELQQKWENFGEIEVKLSDLATSDLMRLHGAETQAHTRRNDDPYTPARKEKMRAALEPEMREKAKLIYDDLQRGADLADKEQQVADRVRSRIRGAGILAEREQENASVAIQTAMVTTLARRVGADPVEFYDQHYPRIQGNIDGMVAEEGVLEQAQIQGYEGQDTGEAASWVRAKAKGLPMETEARMARAREMGFDTDEVFYHGTGDLTNFSVGFDPNMTGLGNDQLGSGFYFTNQAATASGYTTRRLPTGESKLGGEDAPGVLPVVLNIQNPIVLENGTDMLSQKVEITAEQAEAIIRQSPLLAEDLDNNPLGNWHDIWSEGVQDWMIGDVASSYEGNTILSIENDFFKGHAEAFRRAVRDVLGYDGVIQKFDSGEVHKVAWFPEQVRSVHAAFDPDMSDSGDLLAQQRRGQFSPSRNIITMFEAADVTTLMHEGAHWYLAEIERMASAENPHPFVVEQWEAVKKWYEAHKKSPAMVAKRTNYSIIETNGRFSVHERTDKGVSIRASGLVSRDEAEARIDYIEMQEAFAETFEVYLQTGKAPVPSLREAFRGFKAWITDIWSRIRKGQIVLPARANLSPDIVRVMDRMLAVDEEIESQTAEVVTKAEAMANDLYERGIITKRQRDAAIMNLDQAREAAKEEMMAQIMQAEMRIREAQLSAERRRIQGDVVREYDRSTGGRAVSWLGYGQWKGDVPVGESPGRDAADMEMYQRGQIVSEAQAVAAREFDNEAARLIEDSQFRYEMLDEELAKLTADVQTKLDALEDRDTVQMAEDARAAFYDPRAEALDPDSETYDADLEALEAEADRVEQEALERAQDEATAEELRLMEEMDALTDRETQRLEAEAEAQIEAYRKQAITELVDRFEAAYGAAALLDTSYPDYMDYDQRERIVLGADGVPRSIEAILNDDSLGQSIRKATSLSDQEVSQWYVENVTEERQELGGDESIVQLRFKTEDGKASADANIRIQFNTATGAAKADLFLGRSLGKSVDGPEALPTAIRMFSRAIVALRAWSQLETPKAIMFSGASESHDRLYRYMLSSLEFSEYKPFHVSNTFGTVNTSPEGVTTGDTMFGASSFILLRDGENIETYAKEEINKGRRTAGGSSEVVNITRVLPMGRPARRSAGGMDAGGLGTRADDRGRREGGTDGAVDDTLGQSLPGERTLFVAHNTSEEKLRKTLELGGFPMPSLAVARTDKGGFPGYGEITFLADPRLLDEPDVTAYDADIYSPRVPEQFPKVSPEKAGAFVKRAKAFIPEGAMIPEYLGYDETDRDLPRSLMSNELVQLAYLAEQGRAPKLKKLKVAKEVKAALKTEYDSPERAALALAYYTRLDRELNAARAEKGIEPTNIYLEDDGTVSYRNQRNFDDLISEAKRSPFDQKAFKSELYDRTMGSLKAREKFAKYTAELAGDITESYRMFKGFTYSGNRKWAPFNLENVMAEMRKDLREGNHDAFGGTGSIRARVASTPMKKMKDVQRNRDRIVSDQEMQDIKDRQAERFTTLADEIARYYKFAASGIRYYDAAAEAIAGGPKEWRESFTEEALPAIRAYVEELKALPTEYFEAKANRVMQLGDFAVAVVPRTVSPDIKQALQASGVQIRYYKKGDEADRLRQIEQQDDLLFQSAPTFYSALGRFIASSNTARAPAAQWKGMIQNAPGVKAEEVEWTGVLDWLDASEGPVTREALAAFVEANGVRVEEVSKGAAAQKEIESRLIEIQRELLPQLEERERITAQINSERFRKVWELEGSEKQAFDALVEREGVLFDNIRRLEAEQRQLRRDDESTGDTKWSS